MTVSASASVDQAVILAASALTKTYREHGFIAGRSAVRPALLDVSLELRRGDVLGVVGESGSGKTTLARCLTGLETPDRGEVMLDGLPLLRLKGQQLRAQRRRIQIVFQDPFASLNPRLSVRSALTEVLRVHKLVPRAQTEARIQELLELVGLRARVADRFPADFSGGQRQRICLARALAAEPDVLIADEAVSSLDVSIQAQVINLLTDLRQELGLTMIFISHDLHVVQHVAPNVAIMFGGRIVEFLRDLSSLEQARHPYTIMLHNSLPSLEAQRLPTFHGTDLSSALPQVGCPFRERCDFAFETCSQVDPPLAALDQRHLVACHYVHERDN